MTAITCHSEAARYDGMFRNRADALRFLRFLRREKAETVEVDSRILPIGRAIAELSQPPADPRQMELF